ncbi:radical SAM protein [Candidatus Woesearchaeota archaeon]|nr:radical SAM protein [Candidatus Woesearchaeota archaeon]
MYNCYNFWRSEDEKLQKPTEKQLNRALEISERIIEADVFHVTLTGGEPFLFGKNLEQIIKLYRESNVGIRINSNITLANDEICDILMEYNVGVLSSIISHDEDQFNKTTQNKVSFKRFVKGAQLLSNKGIYLSANMVVNKSTLDSVYDTGKFAYELGFKGFNATRISPSNNGMIQNYDSLILNNKDIVILLDQLMELKSDFGMQVGTLNALPYCAVDDINKYGSIFNRSCVAGLTSAGVASNGDLRACQHFDITYGNIFERPLLEIWAEIPIWKKQYHNDTCTGCAYDFKCGGGCKENAYKINKDMAGEDNLKKDTIKNNKKTKISSFDPVNSVQLKRDLKIRDESFGSTLFKDPSAYAYLDNFTTFYIKEKYPIRVLNRNDLVFIGSDIGVDNQYVSALFATLINNNLGRDGG